MRFQRSRGAPSERDKSSDPSEGFQRSDGRDFLETAEVSCEPIALNQEEGKVQSSFLVKASETSLIVNCFLQKSKYADSGGSLAVDLKFHPMSLSREDFENRNNRVADMEVEYARVIDKIIRSSGLVDFEALDEEALSVTVNFIFLEFKGHLFSSCIEGTKACFQKISEAVRGFYARDLFVERDVRGYCFCYYRGRILLLDPTREEEERSTSSVVLGFLKCDDNVQICGLQLLFGELKDTALNEILLHLNSH